MTKEKLAKANALIEKINALNAINDTIKKSDVFQVKCFDMFDSVDRWVTIPEEITDYLTTFIEETFKKLSKEFEEL